jgi:hypothetical protein
VSGPASTRTTGSSLSVSATLSNVELASGISTPCVSKPSDVYTWLVRSLLDIPQHDPDVSKQGGRSWGGRTCTGELTGSEGGMRTRNVANNITELKLQAQGGGLSAVNGMRQQKMLPYVLHLLESKWDRLDAAAALDALPGRCSFRDVSGSLAAMSTVMARRSRSCQLQVCPLLRSPACVTSRKA